MMALAHGGVRQGYHMQRYSMTHRKGVRGAFTAAIVAGAGLFGSNAIAEDFVI